MDTIENHLIYSPQCTILKRQNKSAGTMIRGYIVELNMHRLRFIEFVRKIRVKPAILYMNVGFFSSKLLDKMNMFFNVFWGLREFFQNLRLLCSTDTV